MPEVEPSRIQIQRSGERFLTRGEGTSTRHSFSYGAHYDPANIGFGQLIAINEETVEPGRGYESHHHADVEIVTWVLEGTLLHEDDAKNRGEITPGLAQRLSAGSGVRHSERNASKTEKLRFIQMMLRSENDGEPAYERCAYERCEVGAGAKTVSVLNSRALLVVVRSAAGEMVHVPASPLSYVHVTAGTVSAAEHLLRAGDALRLTDAGAYDLSAQVAAEVLIWQMRR